MVDEVIPERDPIAGLQERFARSAEWLAEALAAVGVDARVGKIAGEFCPGEPYLFCEDVDGYEVEIWYELPTAVDPKA